MLKRLIQDKKGSALVLSICLLAIIAILAVGMAGVTSMVYKKTAYDVNRQQAYFNAKSGIETALNSIVSQKDDALIQAIRNAGGTLVSDPIDFADGTYTLTLRLLNSDPDNPQLSVTATGEDHGKKYSISSKVEGSITRTKPPFAVTHAIDMNGNIQLVNGIKIFAEDGHGVISRGWHLTLASCYIKGGIEANSPTDGYLQPGEHTITSPVNNNGAPYIDGNFIMLNGNFNPQNLYLTNNFYSSVEDVKNRIVDGWQNSAFLGTPKRTDSNTFYDNALLPSPPLDSPDLPTEYYTWDQLLTAKRTFEGVEYKLYEIKNGVPTINTSAGDVNIVVRKDVNNSTTDIEIGTTSKDGGSVNIFDKLNIIGDGNVGIYMTGQSIQHLYLYGSHIGKHIDENGNATGKTKLYFMIDQGNPQIYFGGNQTIDAYFLVKDNTGVQYNFEGDNITINGGLRGKDMDAQFRKNLVVNYVPTEDGFTQGGSSSTNASWSVGGFQKGDGK